MGLVEGSFSLEETDRQTGGRGCRGTGVAEHVRPLACSVMENYVCLRARARVKERERERERGRESHLCF